MAKPTIDITARVVQTWDLAKAFGFTDEQLEQTVSMSLKFRNNRDGLPILTAEMYVTPKMITEDGHLKTEFRNFRLIEVI